MRVLLQAVSAKTGGAVNYLRNIARVLATTASNHEFLFLTQAPQARALDGLAPNIRALSATVSSWLPSRLWYDQVEMRRLLRREAIDVLFSTANFALFDAPCPQVLLVRNCLYFSTAYLERTARRKPLAARAELALRRWLIGRSVRACDLVMTPTQSMLHDLRRFVAVPDHKAAVNPFGVDLERFARAAPAPRNPGEPFRLLFSSLYGEHKNFDTLLRALALVTDRGLEWRLTTPAQPDLPECRWTCTWKQDARLAADPRIRDRIRYTGVLDSERMASLYGDADIFVYPSAVESFGHPLVEAMAAGLPIVAADCAVNRELAGDAVLYFSPFDASECAARVEQLMLQEDLRAHLSRAAAERSRHWTWPAHVQRLLAAFSALHLRRTGAHP